MKVAVLSPVAWRTPPEHYGPWEQMASNLTENLVKLGCEVTLFATADSLTNGALNAVIDRGYEIDKSQDAKVVECLHISNLMENANQFDIIHNHFDFLPLTYSRLIKTPLITTIHGFSSEKIVLVYKKYNSTSTYVSISDADRHPDLEYIGTVYNGVNLNEFLYSATSQDYLLYFGRIHHDKGTAEAISIAKALGKKLIIAGIIQDQNYFNEHVKPHLGEQIEFVGSAGPELRNQLMGNAELLLHPINFKEPFGLSVVEAMLCGTPVLAFNKGSMPELITHNKNGFLVDNVEEAVALLKDKPKIERSVCREIAESRFSAERMAADYLEIYKQILSRRFRL
ncbi:glycosyltransferase family 4 protein [Pseudoxanthomonas sp. SGD-10]|nr:glycosyltransferase family 4 protein [Pseudoxanthomonas sp. SGD-10]